jgi:hypothetical protein
MLATNKTARRPGVVMNGSMVVKSIVAGEKRKFLIKKIKEVPSEISLHQRTEESNSKGDFVIGGSPECSPSPESDVISIPMTDRN